MSIISSRLAINRFMERYFSRSDIGPEMHLIVHWNLIVGNKLSKIAFPSKVFFSPDGDNTLVINVRDGSDALEVRYSFSEILDRISRFYGYKLINKLFIKQRIRY